MGLELWRSEGWKLAPLALLGAAILGYHPYAEDGGIYLAEIKNALDARLYPVETEFVSGHLGWSRFTAIVATVVRVSGWKLDWVVFGLHLLTLFAIVAGVWLLAAQAYAGRAARWGATGLVALCLTTPVAGTSLILVDPYLTARSVCLALTLLGMAAVANSLMGSHFGWLAWGIAALAGATVVHPLMAGYGIGAVLVLVCLQCRHGRIAVGGTAGLAFAALVLAASTQRSGRPESVDYLRVASTRYYWFLSQWHWFEWIGLVAPLVILAWFGWARTGSRTEQGLSRMAVCLGGISLLVAIAFAREGGVVHLVARMQPLRCFQVIYVVLLLVLGGWLGERVLRGFWWRWVVAAGLLGGLMLYVERSTYPASEHQELPGVRTVNRWEEAFVWVRDNTPRDVLFGLDSDYVHRPGEDAQGFRALAERSALPDYSKDGGQAAIRPELTEAWAIGQRAQERLTEETDSERLAKLRPLGVSWVVMGREGVTGFVCPYQNDLVKVCQLP